MKAKTIKLDGRNVPVQDVLEVSLVMVADTLYSQFRYRLFEPCHHIVSTLVPRDKALKLESTVRKACLRS